MIHLFVSKYIVSNAYYLTNKFLVRQQRKNKNPKQMEQSLGLFARSLVYCRTLFTMYICVSFFFLFFSVYADQQSIPDVCLLQTQYIFIVTSLNLNVSIIQYLQLQYYIYTSNLLIVYLAVRLTKHGVSVA
jgi:hypothetical protein